jgi:TerC family integral membrane protein
LGCTALFSGPNLCCTHPHLFSPTHSISPQFIKTSDHYDGDKFWTTAEDGARLATPLLLALAVVELSDVIFAVDSIPAVFGVTLDPFIIYTSNIFAILSLRSLYGFVSSVMTELRFLDKSVALVLGFIGAKMLLGFADIEVSTDVSLLVVGLVLGAGVAASLVFPEPEAK